MHSLLRNGDFRTLFTGRLVTNAGDSLYFIAAMWLVYDLTGSEFYSGLAGFLTIAPQAVQAFAGPLVDRWNVRRLLVGTQLVQGALVLAIPVTAYTGNLSVWVVLAVMPTLSLLNALVYPAQSAVIPRIVEQDELVAANSALSLAYQGVDSVFNALSGVLVAVVGAISIFVLDAVTFAVAASLFAATRIPAAEAVDNEGDAATSDADPETGRTTAPVTDGGEVEAEESEVEAEDWESEESGYLADLREGVSFLRGTIITAMLGGTIVINFTFGGAIATLPSYGDSLGGATVYGLLMAAIGGGLFVGALAANVVDDYAFGKLAIVTTAVGGLAWLAAIALSWTPATVALLLCATIPAGITNVLIVSMVQAVVPQKLLGRVSGIIGSASSVAVPVGALLGGTVASAVGPKPVLYAAGTGLLFLAAYIAAVPSLRGMPAVGEVETLSR